MSLISGNAIFNGDAVNCSSNSISGLAVFFGTATNAGDVTSAVFNDGAVNCGSITSGVFLGSAINSGSVSVAEFFGTASNAGFVVESAKFADTSSNIGTVSGSAIFTDTSISDGVVEGAVQLGVNVTEGENQALTETPTEYTQTDGFFPNAHYSGASKTAPTDYETVVHQVGSFWYKYDGNGDGSLASGNYSDGTSMFTFFNGIKGAAYTPSYNVLGSYYYVGTLTSGTTVLYSDNGLTAVASEITPFVVAGVARYSTNGSGVVTIENIQTIDSYYYVGTLTSGTTVLYSDNGLTAVASEITPFVEAGIARYSTNDSGVVTVENIQTIGSYYYAGTFTNGVTVLYSNDALSTPACLSNVNLGDISNPLDGFDDYISTVDGVATITYGQSTACSICLGNNAYYYTGQLNNGNTLYSNNGLTCLATCVLGNAGDLNADSVADFICTDADGIICTLNGQCYEISTNAFYSFRGLVNGAFLYTDSNLTSLALDATLKMTDQNGDGISDFATISNGILCCINGSCVNGLGYYTGVATSIGNSYYSDGTFDNKLGSFSDCCIDINGDGIIDSVQITAGNLVQIVNGRTATIDSCTFYWLSAGTYDCAACLANETLYSDGCFTTTLSNACMNIGNDQYLCTDNNGYALIC